MQAEDPLESGIDIIAQPPGTKLNSLTLLSGGQKTLTAVALLFAVQAADLRTFAVQGSYDARSALSPATCELYEAVREVVLRPPSASRPYIWNDDEQSLELHIDRLVKDLAVGGRISSTISADLAELE